MICPKCNHSWDYKGKSIYYLTCPHCYQKIRAPKLSPQPSTHLPTQLPTQESTQPIVDKAEIEKKRAKYIKYYNTMNVRCGPGAFCHQSPVHSHLCSDCGTTFEMMSAALSFCPRCGGKNVEAIPDEIDDPRKWHLCLDCDTMFLMRSVAVSFCPCCHSRNIGTISNEDALDRDQAMVEKYALTDEETEAARKKHMEYSENLVKQLHEESKRQRRQSGKGEKKIAAKGAAKKAIR